MIRIAFAVALSLLPLAARAQQNEPFKPGLGEIMTLQQMRHLKLWFAAQSGNWGLADYELDELKEGFEDITKYYPTKDNVPTGTMAEAVVAKEVADLAKAIEALRARPQRLDRCMEALQVTTVPKALLWKRIKALKVLAG